MGGRASHAAVVARGIGRPAVCGVEGLEIDPAARLAIQNLLDRLSREPVTLLFAARDEAHNNAVALKEWLESRAP